MPNGEKVLAQSKRTAPPPISKMYVAFQIWIKKRFFNWYVSKLISKTLLNTKRRISLRGSFV
jgi:hypothetical protein